ncbi:MAG: hypothetical protein EB158_03875, partial [Nitrosopumilaceae archaeon]|nr:hypothetical protein [Nitrosopumilaceae archaeon]
MAKTTLSILTAIVLLSAAVLVPFAMMDTAHADKAKGSPSSQGAKAYGGKASLKICGDKLCKDAKKTTAKPAAPAEPAKPAETAKQSEPITEATPAEPAKPAKPAEPAKPMTEKTDQAMTHTYTITSKTMTSVTDPGVGHESHQLAVILPPSEKIYKGSITFAAS